jgi:hypothetical protein
MANPQFIVNREQNEDEYSRISTSKSERLASKEDSGAIYVNGRNHINKTSMRY